MANSPKFHPALTVTNIKSLVSVILDNEQGLYHSWATLFINLARVYDFYDHLVPPTEALALAANTTTKSADRALWKRLDVVILQWIYTTIAPDLLLAILKRNDTAEGAWNRLESLFQDKKPPEPSISRRTLRTLLADVDAPVTNSRLILRLTGFTGGV
ncbi:uncharacterized protein LOC129900115 [Solanum dulcamara]|uniref:uncharacterized protein LOC129900115 n=1 Tax=Solanum dulcamara TaxID=45834 RepID=UPI0024865331|nr:uncharacterized protein LOC129900115 [Solanum dulcamara]